MTLSNVLHVLSIIFGLLGIVMWFLLIFGWYTRVSWFVATNDLTLMIGCTLFSFLAAIWLQVATIHHMMLERKKAIV